MQKLRDFLKKWLWAFYLVLAPVYMELIFRLICTDSSYAPWLTLAFALAAGLLVAAISALVGRKAFRAVSSVLLGLSGLLFSTQAVYRDIFQTTLGVGLLGQAGGVFTTFAREAFSGIAKNLPVILALLLPFILWLIFSRRLAPEGFSRHLRLLLVAGFVAIQAGTTVYIRFSSSGALSPAFLYGEGFVLDQSVEAFGVLTTFRLDAAYSLLPAEAEEEPIPTLAPTPAPKPVPTPKPDEPVETQPPFMPEAQVLDIDFAGLYEAETNSRVKTLHSFFAAAEPSYTNEYTGLFEGKNLIWICAESFSPWAVDEELTPTLYKLANSGFVFDNFYCPVTGASTTGGEFITLSGLMQNSSQQLMQRSGRCYMPYGMGNLMNGLGYTSIAYHNGQYTYYGRDKSHPNLGYEFKANRHGLALDEPGLLPTSDLDMMKNSLPDYMDAEHFNIYYMTISGHMEYKFGAHAMCDRYRETVESAEHLSGYTRAAKAYVASQIDLDRGMELLLKELEEAGRLEDTVIVMSPDHYPYDLENKDFESMLGHKPEKDFEKYHSTLILWCGGMEETVRIDKPCSSIDILPTILNLFGIDYDSRLVMGRDILSTSPGFVAFPNYSFISDLGAYASSTRTFALADGVEDIPESYISDTVSRIKTLYKYSEEVLNVNYYDKVIPQNYISRDTD